MVKCSEVLQCSDDLSNKVSSIIMRYIDNMKFLLICILRLSHSFVLFRFYILSMHIYSCIPFNIVIYVFLLLCLCILIVCLCIFIEPDGTLRLP